MAAVLVGSYVFPYPLFPSPTPIYICAGILLLCNYFYFCAATKKKSYAVPKDIVLAMVQVEADLVILTAVLLFSGGVANPFFLFYTFHIIIATIILPRNLSFAVGLTTILLFGLLAINELNGGTWLGYYPLQIKHWIEGLWTNPVYVLAAFVAFVCTVFLTQYLIRIVIARMTVKEREAARNNDLLRAIIGAMTEGLIFITPDGKIAMCNPAAKLWENEQTSKNSHIDKSEDLPDDFPPILAEHIRGLSIDNNITTDTGGDKAIKFKTDGSEQRYIEAKSSPVIGIDEQKLGHIIVGQDLTVHKKLEEDLLDRTEEVTAINEMLKMSRIEMAQREKMVAIGQMATGIGMSPEVCKRAFESFLTTKEIGKGTGLGLFISYNLVTEVDGTLSMESKPGKGTTATIRIPIRPKKDLFNGNNDKDNFTNKVESIQENNV